MEDEIRELLGEEIVNQIKNLPTLSGEEQRMAVDNVAVLYRLRIEELRNDTEKSKIKNEMESTKNQIEDTTKDRYFKLGIEIAGLVLPLMFYGTWMRRGFAFEETGTYTSTTFRGLFSRFRPTKK